MQEIFYLIYQTTNLINDKIYIGCHITKNINDDYLGSGTLLRDAIKKYGRENFERQILFECSDSDEMRRKERELVNEEFVNRDDVYNIVLGGNYGEENRIAKFGKIPVRDNEGNTFTVTNNDPRYLSGELVHTSTGLKHSDETRQIMSEKATGHEVREETKKKISESMTGEKNYFFGKHHTKETKELLRIKNSKPRKEPFTEEHRERLSKNKTGKRWITSPDLLTLKQVSEDKLSEFLDSGWILGYKYHIKA